MLLKKRTGEWELATGHVSFDGKEHGLFFGILLLFGVGGN